MGVVPTPSLPSHHPTTTSPHHPAAQGGGGRTQPYQEHVQRCLPPRCAPSCTRTRSSCPPQPGTLPLRHCSAAVLQLARAERGVGQASMLIAGATLPAAMDCSSSRDRVLQRYSGMPGVGALWGGSRWAACCGTSTPPHPPPPRRTALPPSPPPVYTPTQSWSTSGRGQNGGAQCPPRWGGSPCDGGWWVPGAAQQACPPPSAWGGRRAPPPPPPHRPGPTLPLETRE